MRRTIVFTLMIVLLGACSTKEIDIQAPHQDDIIYYASFEQPAENGTRVYANEELHLRWTADDRVSIFGKNTYNQQYKFLGETGDNSGGFSKVEGAEYVTGNPISHTISVYPYQASTKITEDEVLTVILPAEQHYAENTFGPEANTMVSVSEDNVLMYKNVGGYLRISLYGEGVSVSSITLKGNNGEKLAGKASVTMPLDGVPSVTLADNAKTEIILSCDTPVQLGSTEEESTHFWFVVPPVLFEKGFTVSILEDKAGIFEKETSNSIIINRNNLSKMSAIMVDKVPLPVPEAIDLGLSVKWADMNLGALSPSDDGDWYAWGETETKDYYDWDNYKWCNGPSTTSTNHYLTKYNSDSNYGVVDYKTVLEPEDDAAFVKLGANWRMPTREDFVELSQNCDWEQTTLNGVTGYLVKSRVNSNSIFLYYTDEPFLKNLPLSSTITVEGNYWSADVYSNPPSSAYRLMIRPDGIFPSAYARRCHGRNIRPVYDDPAQVLVTSIQISDTELNIYEGDTHTITAIVLPENATNKSIKWASSDESIATVDQQGVVSAISAGTTTITATIGHVSANCVCNVIGYHNSIDLSASGTANCYIVPSAGFYCFKATKGNSNVTVDGVAAEVLWRSFNTTTAPDSEDIILDPVYRDGFVYFMTPNEYKEGNAVIALKAQDGTVLWSWHIWATSADLEMLKQIYANGAGIMMDRNLGALSATPRDPLSIGLLYEWGRKDPFMGCASFESTTPIATDVTWPSAKTTRFINQQNYSALDYSISHPMDYIYNSELPYDWQSLVKEDCDYLLWQSNKTMYDPCPAGWRVPDGGENGIWKKAGIPEGSLYNSYTKGIMIGSPYCIPDAWYPSIGGGRQWNGGGMLHVGEWGNYWSCTYMYESWMEEFPISWNYYYTFDFYSSATRAKSNCYSGQGIAVRCCKE